MYILFDIEFINVTVSLKLSIIGQIGVFWLYFTIFRFPEQINLLNRQERVSKGHDSDEEHDQECAHIFDTLRDHPYDPAEVLRSP